MQLGWRSERVECKAQGKSALVRGRDWQGGKKVKIWKNKVRGPCEVVSLFKEQGQVISVGKQGWG